jgi:hypothetical protein
MTRGLLPAVAFAWVGFTMLLGDLLAVGSDPRAVHSAALVQYAGLLLVCGLVAFPRRRVR